MSGEQADSLQMSTQVREYENKVVMSENISFKFYTSSRTEERAMRD